MRAGTLDRRVVIQAKTVSQNDSGEEVVVWDIVSTVWAQKVESRGAERFAAQQLKGVGVKTFRFRWSAAVSGITVEDQIQCDGRDYDIIDVREIGRREGIEVDCFAPSDVPMVPVP